jgi:hypothetical protein
VVKENTKNREQELAVCRQIIARQAAGLMERLESRPGKRAAEGEETSSGWAINTGLPCGA